MDWALGDRFRIRRERHYGDRLIPCFAERPPHIEAMVAAQVADHGEREAVVCGDERLSYGVLERRVSAIAANLGRAGVAAGDRVALLLGNRLEFVTAVLACAHLGAVSVPMNIRQRRPEIAFVLNDCAASTLLHEAELADELPGADEVPSLARRYVCGGACAGALPFADLEAPARAPAAPVGEEDVACILYTSGTTGRPKGAMLTHLGIVHSVLHFAACMNLTAEDRSVLAVPASHVTGLVANILTMLGVGGCIVIMPTFKAADFIALAAAEGMTQSVLVPAMYNLCLLQPEFERADLSAWRLGCYGGAPMPTATIDALARRLPELVLVNAYGATETTSPTTIMPLGTTALRPDSVGKVLPCGELRVMDDEGREVAPGEPGEIWIGGAMVVPGYWGNAQADAENFCGGFWKSGDIGAVDGDGFVRILDRKKDMINRAGYKIYSAEVENELSHHPKVVECAVVAKADPVLGERVHAFVMAVDGTSAEDLAGFCAVRLSDYKVPESFTFVAEPLPRNANGKVMKSLLRERLG